MYICQQNCRQTAKIQTLFKDILTFLGLDFGDASLITLYLDVIGNGIKTRMTTSIKVKH